MIWARLPIQCALKYFPNQKYKEQVHGLTGTFYCNHTN